jgi:uncharacterized protein YceK
MKRILLVLLVSLFLSGCAAMKESGWYEHPTQYKSWNHAKFSLWGYKHPDAKDARLSNREHWWGIPIDKECLLEK